MVVRVYTGGDHEREHDDGRGADSASGTAAPAEGGANDPRPERDRPAPRHPPLDARLYAVGDEPLALGWPVDYRYLYDLVLDRFEREEERVKSLDGKLSALLAGVVASIGFSFRAQLNVASAGAAMLYLIPLGLITWAYTIRLGKFAPTVEALQASFPAYPVSTLVEAIEAMRIANAANVGVHDRKAAVLDRAVIATLAVTLVVLVMQFVIALYHVHGEASWSFLHRMPTVTNAAIRMGGSCRSWATSQRWGPPMDRGSPTARLDVGKLHISYDDRPFARRSSKAAKVGNMSNAWLVLIWLAGTARARDESGDRQQRSHPRYRWLRGWN